MTSRRRPRPWRVDGAVGVGIGLIALGALLALDVVEVIDAWAVLAGWWPVGVVLVGLWWLVAGSVLIGVAIAVLGGLLLATTQDLVAVSVGELILPGLSITLGVLLLHAGRRLRRARFAAASGRAARPTTASGSSRATASPSSTAGGARLAAGASATAVFGDARLGLGAEGADVDRLVVSATSVFGDVNVEVPAGWRVEEHITRVLGDVRLPASQPSYPESPVVELHGLVVFGDVRVRHVDVEGA